MDKDIKSERCEMLDPVNDIESVFIRLRDELIDARFAYDTGDDAGRLGAMLAVAAATNFLKEMGVPAELREPLVSLAAALNDAQRGLYNAMFDPEKEERTSPLQIAQYYAQAQAALAMELFMRRSPNHPRLDRQSAAKKVVGAVREWELNLPLKRGALTWRTIAGWRNKLKNGLSSDPAVQMFKNLVHKIEKEGIDPHEAANRLLTFPRLAQTIANVQNSD